MRRMFARGPNNRFRDNAIQYGVYLEPGRAGLRPSGHTRLRLPESSSRPFGDCPSRERLDEAHALVLKGRVDRPGRAVKGIGYLGNADIFRRAPLAEFPAGGNQDR